MGDIAVALATTHAPQLLIRPKDTEDPEEVARVHDAMRVLGHRLDESGADTLVVFALDHLENYLDHLVAPFIVYTGEVAEGNFGPYRPRYKVDTELAERILRHGIEASFDLAYSQNTVLDHSFVVPLYFIHPANTLPIVPIIVNAYLAPQPTPRRCFELGAALREILRRSGRRVALLASGGMSHYPGTPKYPHPNFDFDRHLLKALEQGQGARLQDMTSKELDETGNVELRTWMIVMGIIGADRPATVVTYEPCWHHGHGVLYWTPNPAREMTPTTVSTDLHYPYLRPQALSLNRFLLRLRADAEFRTRYLKDPEHVLVTADLTREEREALVRRDVHGLVAAGAHPMLAILINVFTDMEERPDNYEYY